MIQAFFGVSVSGTTGYPTFGLLLGGVGQALLTTAFGLMIAIMAHIAHHFLHGRVRALVHDMEYTGHELIQFMCSMGTTPDAASDENVPDGLSKGEAEVS